jgi:hypothetical protein
MSNKFGIDVYVKSAGVISPEIDITDDTKIVLVSTNANAGNTIILYGRISGNPSWTVAGTLTGSGQIESDVSLFDFVKLECTVYDSVSNYVQLVGSGFRLTAGIPTVTTPSGTLTNVQNLDLISSDSSVDISVSGSQIDLKSAGGGGTFIKYVKTVILGDWVGPSAGEYTLTIAFAFHGVTNPTVACYETNGANFDLVAYPVKIDASHNIVITAGQTPDTRFVGKIVIE